MKHARDDWYLTGLLSLLLLLAPMTGRSVPERFYLGANTGPGRGEGIYQGTIDSDTGRLGPVTLAVRADNPGYLALAPDGAHLYAIGSDNGGAVAAFAVAKDGALTALNQVSSGGAGPCHLSVDPSGRNVLVANYSGGNIACIRIQPDGSLGEQTAEMTFHGAGPDPVRQKKPFAHFIAADSAGRFVYACDLGTDHVWSVKFDAETGKFNGLTEKQAVTAPGSGPRHLAFGPGENFAYVNGEMGRTINVFQRDKATGELTAIQTLPIVPGAVPGGGVTTAEVVLHPSGKWLYVSSRYDNIMAVFAVGGDGRLAFVQDIPAGVKVPRGFNIDPAGRWLIAAGQDDGRIVVFSIAPDTGKLTPTAQEAKVPAAICVLFPPPHP